MFRLRLVLLPAIATVAAVVVPATSASASVSPAAGWHAEWKFTDDHHWTYSLNIGNATVSGTGYDDDNIRYISGTVTDMSWQSHLCAVVDFTETAGVHGQYTACGGSINFSYLDETPSDLKFTLSLKANNQTSWDQSIHITVPDTSDRPDLRSNGVGAGWEFFSNQMYNFRIVRPGAAILGTAHEVTQPTASRWFQVATYTSGCARTDLWEYTYNWTNGQPWEMVHKDEVCQNVAEFSTSLFYDPIEVRSCLKATLLHPKGYLYTTWTHRCVSLETP